MPQIAELLLPLRGKGTASRGAQAPDDNPAVLAIWHVIATIPAGRVCSYGGVARAAGYRAARD